MSSINFDNAYLLLIAIPLVAVFTIPFVIAVRKENANGHNIASQVLHILMAILIAFAAAGTSIRTVLTETDVFVVADVSYSAERNLDTVDNYIRGLGLPINSRLGLVCFGKNAKLVYNLGDPRKVPSVKNSGVDDSSTDIAGALEYTGELFKDDVIKRIVLITDGHQSDESDDYALNRAVDGLEAKNIRVDAIYLDDNITQNEKEVQLTSVQFTASTYLGREEEAEAVVQSTMAANAIVTLTKNGEVYKERAVTLSVGLNNIDFELDTSEEGSFDYEVNVSVPDDSNSLNNNYLFTQTVASDIRVLYITESWADLTAAVEMYGEKASIDAYEYDTSVRFDDKMRYQRAHASNENLNINIMTHDIPASVEQLCRYDEIVLADADLTKFTAFEEFIGNLDKVVSQFGKSLVTLGNLGLQTSREESMQDLGDMLPVRYGNADQDPKLYTLVVDTSRSMRWLFHLDIAKQLCTALLDLLNDGDELCIVTFFGEVRVALTPTPINASTRQNILDIINNFDVLQGTLIGAGLATAYEYIDDLEYSDKQVMLISDGLSYGDDEYRPSDVVREMYAAGIVTSVFDVGRQGDLKDGSNTNPTNMQAKGLLQSLASSGNGKYFYSNNLEKLDEVTFGQIADSVTLTIVEREATVNVTRRTDSSLEGLNLNAVPNVSAYMYGGTKPSATTVLTVNHKRDVGYKQVPLYAYWNYGEGKVSSFSSKIGEEWLAYWAENNVDKTFFSNVFEQNMPREKSDVPYSVSVEPAGEDFTITVAPANYQYNSLVTVKITSPDGSERTERLLHSDTYYFKTLDCGATGKYTLDIAYDCDGTIYSSSVTYCYAYAPEYNSFTAFGPADLYKALNGRGTVSLDGRLELTNDESLLEMYNVDLTLPLLITAAVLYVVDIIIRKLRWNDVKSFFGIGKNNRKGGSKK